MLLILDYILHASAEKVSQKKTSLEFGLIKFSPDETKLCSCQFRVTT